MSLVVRNIAVSQKAPELLLEIQDNFIRHEIRCQPRSKPVHDLAHLVETEYFLNRQRADHGSAPIEQGHKEITLKPAECLSDRRAADSKIPRDLRYADDLSRAVLLGDNFVPQTFIGVFTDCARSISLHRLDVLVSLCHPWGRDGPVSLMRAPCQLGDMAEATKAWSRGTSLRPRLETGPVPSGFQWLGSPRMLCQDQFRTNGALFHKPGDLPCLKHDLIAVNAHLIRCACPKHPTATEGPLGHHRREAPPSPQKPTGISTDGPK